MSGCREFGGTANPAQYDELSASTVIVTCDGNMDVFDRALKSALNQSYDEFDIIVVYSGSDKRYFESLEEYVEANVPDGKKLTLIFLGENNNSLARNEGAKASKGRFISFLDDDDEWFPDKIESQIRCFRERDVLVFSNYFLKNESGVARPIFDSKPSLDNMEVRVLGENIVGCTSMVLVDRHAFFAAGGFDKSLKSNQEWDLWIRMLQLGGASYCPTMCGIKYDRLEGITYQKGRRIQGWLRLFLKHAPLYGKNPAQFRSAVGFFAHEMLGFGAVLLGPSLYLLWRFLWLFSLNGRRD